ncbi:MAG: glycosyl hydrolase 115 family protein [Butyrivibrio sp.]|nr:glycosyl hydrolase 115 family protein [Butyrivibrio sp.]
MSKFLLFNEKKVADIIIEKSAYEGVKEIGKTVTEDIALVTDVEPKIVSSIEDVSGETAVLFATDKKSAYLEYLEQAGLIDLFAIRGKREVFLMKTIDVTGQAELHCEGIGSHIRQFLVVAGSDKRGTIYGMFHLSELIGVSPLVYFGDAYPEKKSVVEINITENAGCKVDGNCDTYISKEPSVYYRGFFINDEWPAFGNWATEKFGGVNARCYRKVFELLLRLKGNYMWPAMWNSNFSEEGPGIENARLADELGVIMGTSHHEPLFRAGNEWQQQYREYGDDNSWSFISNAEAITKFWEDGVRRNKDFESVITIGMRGEADSKLLPEDATMKDNIEVVKKAILAQDKILYDQFKDGDNIYSKGKESGKTYEDILKDVPRMLAIYKEVEDYYYGDDTCEGLKDWDELKDVIFLLSDDNHGNLRNLPTEAERSHAGGYGMYYHFDYHGAPISYEWTNCNRLTRTWEQMTTAYEAGVRKMWIVNVGDLKEMEYPLSFFMDLAYDYETYGLNGLNKIEDYVYSWIDKQFAGKLTKTQKKDMFKVLEGYTRFNAMRTPETMNEMIYHPIHFREGERILAEARDILETAKKLHEELSQDALLTYESMIYYAAAASLNLVIAWILTGFNHELAKRGAVYANSYIDEIEKRIALDKLLVNEFHQIADGKWNHCLSSAHTGFRTWDDREWFYPATVKVTPISGAKAIVSFRGYDRYHLGAHWQDNAPIVCDDFLFAGSEEALLDIDAKGEVPFDYEIVSSGDALVFSDARGRVESGRSTVTITKNHKADLSGVLESKGRVNITFDNGEKTYVDFVLLPGEVITKEMDIDGAEFNVETSSVEGSISEKTGSADAGESKQYHRISENKPFCCVAASDFVEKDDAEDAGFEVVDFLGRENCAVKAFPPMKAFETPAGAPSVSYEIEASEDGEYDVIFYMLTRNPYHKGGRLDFFASVNDEEPSVVHSVSDHYYTEWQDLDWAQGVLRSGRCVEIAVSLQKGYNKLKVYAGDPGVIIEKIVIKRKDYRLPESYLGPVSE